MKLFSPFGLQSIFFGSCLGLLSLARAGTVTAERTSATQRLIPLTKMTVGPNDQYHGTVDPSGNLLVFTRKVDLIPHVALQNIATGKLSQFLPLIADSQEPVLSPEGLVAFTYFKHNAGGEVCYRPLSASPDSEDQIECLKSGGQEVSTPFWRNSKELGFLVKDNWNQKSQIVIVTLATGTRRIIAEGRIWSPSMTPGGKYLVYNAMEFRDGTEQRTLMVHDLVANRAMPARFALPGISGFPSITADEKFLYFSHYLNDTNNDNVIDGNDNSVIFRAPMEDILKGRELFPEQLTSVDSNCSFPRPYQSTVFVTCAFEGALDIYQMPLSGIVPTSWSQETLRNAHQTSRSFSDRILILNTIKYRHAKSEHQPDAARVSDPNLIDEQIFSNHLMADDLASARFYVKRLEGQASSSRRPFYRLLDVYLAARERKKVQKSNEVTPSFDLEMNTALSELKKIEAFPRLNQILQGLVHSFLGQTDRSAAILSKIDLSQSVHPLERYFFFELSSWTLKRLKDTSRYRSLFAEMMSAAELTQESQIYYAFRYFQQLQLEGSSLSDRLSEVRLLKALRKDYPQPVLSLINAEEVSLRLVQASTDPEKFKIYGELDRLMSASRDDYTLRKATYIRAILIFAQFQEFKFLNFIARNWLNYTKMQDTEFAYAREVFSFANLDQAYSLLGKSQPEPASSYFYGALTLTDDLESHFGYIRSQVLMGARSQIEQRYSNLKAQRQIDDNMKFVEALLILVDAKGSDSRSTSHLKRALEKLEAMDQDRNSAMRYLLMGYCEMEQMIRLADGLEIDAATFERAHRNLMLAYDQALDNDRIKASALMNLGILHLRAQNHGLGAKFLAKRKPFGFDSVSDKAEFAWIYARALFKSQQPDLAASELEELSPAEQKSVPNWPLFEEHLAFYLQAAGRCEEAIPHYEQFLKSNLLANLPYAEHNRVRINLSYGFCLHKTGKSLKAVQILQGIEPLLEKLPVLPKNEDRWIEFNPLRIKLILYGILAQASQDPISALRKRAELLKGAKDVLEDYRSSQIQTNLQLVDRIKDPAQQARLLKESLEIAKDLGDSTEYIAKSIYEACIAQLVYGLKFTSTENQDSSALLNKIINSIFKAYDDQLVTQPILDFQRMKLVILWTAYGLKFFKNAATTDWKSILHSESAKQVQENLPVQWIELNTIYTAVNQLVHPK